MSVIAPGSHTVRWRLVRKPHAWGATATENVPMSRGHGHIERLVLSSLDLFKQADVQTIAYRAGVRHGSVSAALRSSINRALRNLCRQGLVREAGKYGSIKEWTLTAIHRKESRKARERRA